MGIALDNPSNSRGRTNWGLWYLQKLTLFDSLAEAELESLSKLLHVREFEKRETAVISPETERKVYFLLKGKIKLCRFRKDGKEITLALLKPGEVFGVLGHPPNGDENTWVVALEKTLVGDLREEEFARLLKEKPEMCMTLSKQIGKRLLRIENRLEGLLFRDIPGRLAHLLLRLAMEFPKKRKCGVLIDVLLTQQDLANLIGASRETTSVALNRFKRNGWIHSHRRYICLHDREALRELTE